MHRKLLKYLLYFIIAYLCISLFLAIPAVKSTHAGFFRSTMDSAVSALMPAAFLRLEEEDPDKPYLVRIVYNSQAGVDAQIEQARKARARNLQLNIFELRLDIFVLYILPVGFLAALILATPIPWKRKLLSIAAGLAIYYLICILRIWVLMLASMSAEKVGAYQYTDGTTNTLQAVSEMFSPGLIMMLPVLIWIGVAFRKRDWKKARRILTGQD